MEKDKIVDTDVKNLKNTESDTVFNRHGDSHENEKARENKTAQKSVNTHESDAPDCFPSVKRTRSYAVLEAQKNFTFHIWTKPSSFYHSHENYIEIFIITEGKIVHHFNKQKTVLKTGDAFIVFPGQYHKHSKYKNYSSQHINLTCNLAFAKDILSLYIGGEPICTRQLVHLDTGFFQTVLDYQKNILESTDNATYEMVLKSFISFVIGQFYIKETQTEIPDWLKEFIKKLNNVNFNNDFKLSEIYSVSNYSQTTLSREFKKYTGKTLIAYINELKLNYACNLLKNTTFPLWSIANTVGFTSQAHFIRLFKEHYGITPLQYRKN